MQFSSWNKISVLAILCSLLFYVLYWLSETLNTIYTYFVDGRTLSSVYLLSDVLVPAVGVVLRFLGVSLALGLVYLVWSSKISSFSEVKKKVAVAVFFEGTYFLSLVPISVFYLSRGMLVTFFSGYVLEAMAVFLPLAVLSFKIWRNSDSKKSNLLTWIAFASIGYVVHIWISNMFRWFSMVELSGITFLFQGSVAIGFLNSIITLSLSVVFAIVGFLFISIKDNQKLGSKLFGASLLFLGLHFVIYILYSVFVGASLYTIMAVEVWPVSVLGLGLVTLLK